MTLVLTRLISNREAFIQINENNYGDFKSEGALRRWGVCMQVAAPTMWSDILIASLMMINQDLAYRCPVWSCFVMRLSLH